MIALLECLIVILESIDLFSNRQDIFIPTLKTLLYLKFIMIKWQCGIPMQWFLFQYLCIDMPE